MYIKFGFDFIRTHIVKTSQINDCVYVIDPGVHKELRFDNENTILLYWLQNRIMFRYNSQRGSAVMENQWIAKANAQQRAGRAGRVQPGEAFHLYSEEKHEEMERFPQAEILRIPLEKVVMDIKVKTHTFTVLAIWIRELITDYHFH